MEDYADVAKEFLKYFKIPEQDPNLEFLSQIIRAFSAFPYENLTKIIKDALFSDIEDKFRYPPDIFEDHLLYKTGGTCFSLTFFLKNILEFSGYNCRIFMADMERGENQHCGLIATIDQKEYLVDPGYLVIKPVELISNKTIIIDNPVNKIIIRSEDQGKTYCLCTWRNNKEKFRYRLKNRPISASEFKSLWQSSFSWPMMRSMIITQLKDNHQLYLHNFRLQKISGERRIVERVDKEMERIILEEIGLHPAIIRKAREIISEKRGKGNG